MFPTLVGVPTSPIEAAIPYRAGDDETIMSDIEKADQRGKTNLLRERREKPDTLCLRVRKKLQISQREMAGLLDVSEETIRRIESGVTQPHVKLTLPTLEQLARTNRVRLK